MRYYLSKVSVEGFRGIHNEGDPLEIKFNTDSINSIFARNGYGKTSLFEAIQYAIYGQVSRLENDLEKSEKPESFYQNKFHSKNTSTITLELQPDDGSPKVDIKVVRSSSGNRTVTSPTGHPSPEDLLKSLQEDFTLIDYKRFLKFIDDSALLRGRSFSSLLGLSKYGKLRQALDKVSESRSLDNALDLKNIESTLRNNEREFEKAVQGVTENYKNLTLKDPVDLNDQPFLIQNVTETLKSIPLIEPFIGAGSVMDLDFTACREAIAKAEGGEDKKLYVLLDPRISHLEELAPLLQENEEKAALTTHVQACDKAVAEAGGPNLRTLLSTAMSVIGTSEWPNDFHCEVCGSDTPHSISEHLNESIGKYEQLKKCSNDLCKFISESEWLKRLKKLESSKELAIEDSKKVAGSIDRLCKEGKFSEQYFAEVQSYFDEIEAKRIALYNDLKNTKDALEKKLPPSLVELNSQIAHAEAFKEAINSYKTLHIEIQSLRKQNVIRQRWKEFIKDVSAKVAKAESVISTQKISDIESTYQSFFKAIMREGSDITPKIVRSNTSESIHLNLENFYGTKDVPVRAVLSESYRNAVASSIFFASALTHAAAPRFMILDDITSSFDGGHQINLMDILRTQIQQPLSPKGLQIIILSHDGYLEKYFNRMVSDAGNWRHQVLVGQSPKGSLLMNHQQTDALKTKAQKYLNNNQMEEGESLVRRYLEYKLDQIINKLDIPVPISYASSTDKRVVSKSISAITQAISLYDKAGSLALDTTQINTFKNNYVTTIFANWVSHFESATVLPITSKVLLGVLDDVDTLVACFTYDDTTSGAPVRRWYRALDKV